MPNQYRDYMATAAVFIGWANREVDQLHNTTRPNGPATNDMAKATLLYRAVEINLKMAELTKGEIQT